LQRRVVSQARRRRGGILLSREEFRVALINKIIMDLGVKSYRSFCKTPLAVKIVILRERSNRRISRGEILHSAPLRSE